MAQAFILLLIIPAEPIYYITYLASLVNKLISKILPFQVICLRQPLLRGGDSE